MIGLPRGVGGTKRRHGLATDRLVLARSDREIGAIAPGEEISDNRCCDVHAVHGGRVASFGAKWARAWRAPVNLVVWLIARRYVTTFDGMSEPWSLLADYADLEIEEVALGGAYLAWGTKR